MPNVGQGDARVRYYARVPGAGFYFTRDTAVFTFEQGKSGHALGLEFIGANPAPEIVGGRPASGRVNFLIGREADAWHAGLPTYEELVYRNLWPGIDLAFRGENGQLKYEFRLSPGARVEDIRIGYRGADRVSLDGNGDLLIQTPLGVLRDTRPESYQEID